MADALAIEAARTSSPTVSRIEREEDVYLSTLRRYVAALGGELEINAVFPDRTVSLVAPRRSREDGGWWPGPLPAVGY